jgi:DNA-binding CsgD family transcriptional regulator
MLARAEAHWLGGDLDEASQELARAQVAAEGCDARERAEVAVWRRRVTGDVTAVDGAPQPYDLMLSGQHADAARRWDDAGFPYDAALALLDSDAEADLREAVERLDALGAAAAARKARQRMRELGLRAIPAGPRSSTRADPAGLTRREHEVLELVCAGHTNDEISGRLFISVKTVDHHVSAVLAKLGVPTRKVAATEALRLGLVTATQTDGART